MQEYEKCIAQQMLSTFFGISAKKKKAKKENVCLYPDVSFEESLQEVLFFIKNSDIFLNE